MRATPPARAKERKRETSPAQPVPRRRKIKAGPPRRDASLQRCENERLVLLHAVVFFHGILRGVLLHPVLLHHAIILLHGVMGHGIHLLVLAHLVLLESNRREPQAERENSAGPA